MRHTANSRPSSARAPGAGTAFLFPGLELWRRNVCNNGLAIRLTDPKTHLLQEIVA